MFIDPDRLPKATVTVVAFDGENADPMNGRRMGVEAVGGALLACTPWGELAVQLAGAEGCERIRNSDRLGAAPPGAETLREPIGEWPVLILIDELSIYLRKIRGPAAGLAADAYAEEAQRSDRIAAELESVTGRQITALTLTSEDETVQVLCRRLFVSIAHSRAEGMVRAYQEMWQRHGAALPARGQSEDRAEELRHGYPFHPGFTQLAPRRAIQFQKGLSLSEFQRLYGTEQHCEAALEKARWPEAG